MNLWINEANDCWCWMKTKGIGEARWPSATRNQFQSSLPNGKIELISFAAALAPKGTVQLMNEMNGLLFSRSWMNGCFPLVSLAGLLAERVMGCCGSQCSAKREDKRQERNQREGIIHEDKWEWNEREDNFLSFIEWNVFDEVKWNWWNANGINEMERKEILWISAGCWPTPLHPQINFTHSSINSISFQSIPFIWFIKLICWIPLRPN